ncbi:C2H2-type zinc finger protein [Candidatus Sororendozoicomonas aggregata]|uniref:C2H2-type zinc finger protein n=1 Tax=Candidatus Sororendozoicomonas aggregata TaxID=3073239 RepID=UPI002ED046CE
MPNPPYTCRHCGRAFDLLHVLEQHIRTHTGEKPHVCQICGKGFVQLSTLNKHIRTHTGEKPYKCDVCGRGFVQSGALRIHNRTHTGEKPFVCAVCDESFTHKIQLKKHKCGTQNHFDCPVCQKKRFRLQRTYDAHMVKEHPDFKGHQLSISPPRQPQASTRYAQSPSKVSVNLQTIPGVGTICAVTHTTTSLATGIVTKASQISGPSGESVVVTQMITTPKPATATTSTSTRSSTGVTNAQPFPIHISAVAQQVPGPSFTVSENPLDGAIMNDESLGDLEQMLREDSSREYSSSGLYKWLYQ